jgi:hypothetical protein
VFFSDNNLIKMSILMLNVWVESRQIQTEPEITVAMRMFRQSLDVNTNRILILTYVKSVAD